MDFVVANPGQNDVLLHKHKLSCEEHWEPIKNINEPYVQEMGRFAVMEKTQHLCGVGITFNRVLSGDTMQVMEGKKYSLVVEVTETAVLPIFPPPCSIKLCVAIVLDKQCDKSWKLLSFEFLKA